MLQPCTRPCSWPRTPCWRASLLLLQAGERVLKQCVFAHVSSCEDKAALLAAMIVKLWGLARGLCCEDSADSALHQEVLLPGHLFCKALHERLSVWLATFATQVRSLADLAGKAGGG